MLTTAKCNICHSESLPLANSLILGKHTIQYFSCQYCGFIQTESPFWLEEAYSSPIAKSDLGLIRRNIRYSNFCSALIPLFYDSTATFLDYGGGNGMFVRMMRDKGLDFYWYDQFATNQFARGFEAHADARFSLLTAFEVFEHLARPVESIEEMFRYSSTIIFSTRLLPYWNIAPDEWWYFTPDTGQHISLYSKKSLEIVAQKLNVNLSSNGVSLHILSPQKVPALMLKALSFQPLAITIATFANIGRKSLLEDDYYRLTGRKLSQ